jgi:hypothetical protein
VPSAPVLRSTYAAAGYVYDMAVAGQYVLLASGNAGLVVLSAATPNTLTYAGQLALGGVARSVSASGTTGFLALDGGGWCAVDLSNPAAPSLIGVRAAQGAMPALAASGSTLVVANAASALTALNVSAPLTPVTLAALGRIARALRVTVASAEAYVSADDAGVAVLGLPADSDHDGLVDAWEQQIVDANPADAITSIADVQPGDDFDGDGLSNAGEFAAGTSAVDTGSVFAMQAPTTVPEAGQIIVRWNSVAGRTYSVWRSSALPGGFTRIQSGIAATAPLNEFAAPADGAQGFFLVTLD